MRAWPAPIATSAGCRRSTASERCTGGEGARRARRVPRGAEEPPRLRLPMDTIILAGIRALGAHGVLPEEQGRPQPFEVDVELSVDLASAGRSDVLSDTIDYDGLAARVVQIVE